MTRATTERLKKAGRATAWVAGGAVLFVVVFALSFYMAMKMEMRSSEVVVPELAGKTRDRAEADARELGLAIEVVDHRHDPAIASGRILQQEPPPGAEVRRGRRLKVVLSLGGKVLEVPSLLGQATRTVDIALRREGFLTGDEVKVYDAAPEGTVVAQVPPAGSPSVPGERVHRLVSLGPREPVWVMPDLSGRPRRDVERWLRSGGFRLGPVRPVSRSGRAADTIVGQLPLAGHPVRRRDVVQLSVER